MTYTGPVRPTDEQWEKWYHRMKDVMNVIHQRNQGVACNPREEAMMIDMLERLDEDDTWPHDEVPRLVTSIQCKPGEIMAVRLEDMKVITMRQLLQTNAGFGRFRGLSTPSGMNGLADAWRPPPGKRRVIKPDNPDDRPKPMTD